MSTIQLPRVADPLVIFERLEPDYSIAYCRSQLRRKIDAGEFPEPVRLSGARIAWRESAILEWLASRPVGRIRRPKPATPFPAQSSSRPASRITRRAAGTAAR